jgi:hypothetical protein
MNANHAEPNAENAENSPIQKLNGLIFDLGDTIPEGVYLEMMNHTKQIYEELKKKTRPLNLGGARTIPERIDDIINKEDKNYFLRRITKDTRDNDDGTSDTILKVYGDDNLLFHKKELRKNSLLRVHAFDNDYKFMRITKINEKSFKFDLIKISRGTISITKDKVLKIKDGEYLEDLRNKNIIFYDLGDITIRALYNRLINGKPENEFLEINMSLNELWN